LKQNVMNNVHSFPVKPASFPSCSTFIDGIILSQRFRKDSVPELAGLRTVAYRQNGDIRFDGSVVEIEDQYEPLPERLRCAWIQGSHNTKVQTSSDGTLVQLKGNPGRFNRRDNVFNHDWQGTLAAANRILNERGLPAFTLGEPAASPRILHNFDGELQSKADFAWYAVDLNDGGPLHEGARVWSIHVTRNFVTGSEANGQAVLNWLDSQSVARVKKKRFGKSTVVWGSLKYCQVEAYLKADEMMDHCRGDIEREMMRQNPVYQWCRDNGVVRVEVKAAKDYLRDAGLTWAGDWDMAKVIRLFDERTEVLHRVRTDIEEFDPATLPSNVAMTASAWLRGEDVQRCMKRATFYRHARILREYGIDIAEPRNVASMPIRIKTLEIQAASAPDWYWRQSCA
jgi:hypothetical protein